MLELYKNLLGPDVVEELLQMAALFQGMKVVHVNSTKEGGGVAEILTKMTPLMNEIGVNTTWETIDGNEEFFACTKNFHNLLQGRYGTRPSSSQFKAFEDVAATNAERLKNLLQEADFVFIHDPQPLGLIQHFPNRKGKWIWRCHIDCSKPDRTVWNFLRHFIEKLDGSIFSLEDFIQPLNHPVYLIPPSIDPFTEKNIELDEEEVSQVLKSFNIDKNRPIILQVSRFDRFKDPIGVIEAYRYSKKFLSTLQLVLAGGGATDDPEGDAIFKNVTEEAHNDPDVHLLFLPSTSHRIINALQRGADIVLQKSLHEGFGLTVTEALWKNKPVIGGNTGGIRLQVINHHTGFLVSTPEGAAHRIRYLFQNPQLIKEMGTKGKKLVKENFLITRHLREYLTTMATLLFHDGDRMDLTQKTTSQI